MKHRVTSEDIACIIPHLNKLLDGAYLTQIYDGTEDSTRMLIMKFRNKILKEGEMQNVTYYLLLESGIRVHTIDNFNSVRPGPSGCVSKIRKEIGDKRLYPIQQVGSDRIMDFLFSNEKHFIIELYDRGNFIVTDKHYRIIYATRPYKTDEFVIDIDKIYPIEIFRNKTFEYKNDISLAKGYMVPNSNFSGFSLNSEKQKEFDDINSAMKAYFGNEIGIKKSSKKSKKKEKRKDNRKSNIEGQITKLTKNEDKLLEKANDMQEIIDTIQTMIDIINEHRLNKMGFKEIQNILNQHFPEYKLELNHNFLTLDGQEIDFSKSAYNNLTNIYNKKKVFSIKKERAIEISKNIEETKPSEQREKIVVDRKFAKFENYWWFIKDNFTILCGKSADDNETILNNVEPSDILIHGHFDKSPWGVIKNPEKREVPFRIINYAGYFIVHRSWSWSENYSNDSYYTFPDKVSKSAPSGEYMGKGSRMVHEKNFLSHTPMEMGLGVLFRCGDQYLERLNSDTVIDFGMIMCAPYLVMNDFEFKIKVKPSGKKSDKGRKKLLESAIKKILATKSKHNRAKDYIRAIPFEEWDKICIRTFSL